MKAVGYSRLNRVSHARSPCKVDLSTVFREHFPAKTAPSDRRRRIIRLKHLVLYSEISYDCRVGNMPRTLRMPSHLANNHGFTLHLKVNTGTAIEAELINP